jgi:hypothetical protein
MISASNTLRFLKELCLLKIAHQAEFADPHGLRFTRSQLTARRHLTGYGYAPKTHPLAAWPQERR